MPDMLFKVRESWLHYRFYVLLINFYTFLSANQRGRTIVLLYQTSHCMPNRPSTGFFVRLGSGYFKPTQKKKSQKVKENNGRSISILLNSLACFVFVQKKLSTHVLSCIGHALTLHCLTNFFYHNYCHSLLHCLKRLVQTRFLSKE